MVMAYWENGKPQNKTNRTYSKTYKEEKNRKTVKEVHEKRQRGPTKDQYIRLQKYRKIQFFMERNKEDQRTFKLV